MDSIIARYTWTVKDLLTGRKLTQKLNRSLQFVRLVVLVVISADAYFNYRNQHQLWPHYSIPLVVGVLTFLFVRAIQTTIIRFQFAKRPDANKDVEWTLSDQGILVSTPQSKAEIQWSAFQKVVFSPAGFLFMPNRQVFHFVPTRAFESPADIENLKTLARQCAREFKELK